MDAMSMIHFAPAHLVVHVNEVSSVIGMRVAIGTLAIRRYKSLLTRLQFTD